ncbi:hypothetical protein M5K25_018411 [Dendrobium thyrsiflorum]|uniref:Uncharacterized protein n=1 Tax=Dendrobium thyrsiflorum TaxID=117978 RepID=A0ABD0UI61_DENTH
MELNNKGSKAIQGCEREPNGSSDNSLNRVNKEKLDCENDGLNLPMEGNRDQLPSLVQQSINIGLVEENMDEQIVNMSHVVNDLSKTHAMHNVVLNNLSLLDSRILEENHEQVEDSMEEGEFISDGLYQGDIHSSIHDGVGNNGTAYKCGISGLSFNKNKCLFVTPSSFKNEHIIAIKNTTGFKHSSLPINCCWSALSITWVARTFLLCLVLVYCWATSRGLVWSSFVQFFGYVCGFLGVDCHVYYFCCFCSVSDSPNCFFSTQLSGLLVNFVSYACRHDHYSGGNIYFLMFFTTAYLRIFCYCCFIKCFGIFCEAFMWAVFGNHKWLLLGVSRGGCFGLWGLLVLAVGCNSLWCFAALLSYEDGKVGWHWLSWDYIAFLVFLMGFAKSFVEGCVLRSRWMLTSYSNLVWPVVLYFWAISSIWSIFVQIIGYAYGCLGGELGILVYCVRSFCLSYPTGYILLFQFWYVILIFDMFLISLLDLVEFLFFEPVGFVGQKDASDAGFLQGGWKLKRNKFIGMLHRTSQSFRLLWLLGILEVTLPFWPFLALHFLFYGFTRLSLGYLVLVLSKDIWLVGFIFLFNFVALLYVREPDVLLRTM